MKHKPHCIIARVLMLSVGVLLLADSIFLMLTSNLHIGLFVVFAVGAVYLSFGIMYGTHYKKFPKQMKILFYSLVCIAVIFMLFLIVYGSLDNVVYDEDAVIVLGAGIRGEEPGDSLKRRLDITVDYYNKNPNAIIVVSGGQGPQESTTEAQAMKKYLTEHSIPADRILCEDRATSTEENFAFSKAILDEIFTEEYTVAFITNDYHVYRSEFIASKACYADIRHIHADTPYHLLVPNVVRECLATLKECIFTAFHI